MYDTARATPLSPQTHHPKTDNVTTPQQQNLDTVAQPSQSTNSSLTPDAADADHPHTEHAAERTESSAPNIAAVTTGDVANEMTDGPTPKPPTAAQVRLTGRMLHFTRLHIHGNDLEQILQAVADKVGQKRQSNLPVVVSCHDSEGLHLNALWDGLWALGLQPIGLVTGELDEQARDLRIAIFPADGQRIDGKAKPIKPSAEPKTTERATEITDRIAKAQMQIAQVTTEQAATQDVSKEQNDSDKLAIDSTAHFGSHLEGDLVHNPILRSGQSINHVGGDLILTHGINAGAEAITDYSLHVYGKAEGRLVAGATGDKNARIFCLKFNPSLVSVAGTYCLKEGIPQEFINQAVQVSYVEGQGLVFEHLAT